jgi:hypothetical protein
MTMLTLNGRVLEGKYLSHYDAKLKLDQK